MDSDVTMKIICVTSELCVYSDVTTNFICVRSELRVNSDVVVEFSGVRSELTLIALLLVDQAMLLLHFLLYDSHIREARLG